MGNINKNKKEGLNLPRSNLDPDKISAFQGRNPVREHIAKRNAVDFSSGTLRRIALMQLGRPR